MRWSRSQCISSPTCKYEPEKNTNTTKQRLVLQVFLELQRHRLCVKTDCKISHLSSQTNNMKFWHGWFWHFLKKFWATFIVFVSHRKYSQSISWKQESVMDSPYLVSEKKAIYCRPFLWKKTPFHSESAERSCKICKKDDHKKI